MADLLNKLNIEQTKSRARHSNDNSLAESKNCSVVRKHFGYDHIPQYHAPMINEFYQNYFNQWLCMHRPCMYATDVINEKGKVTKKYNHGDVMTPLERLEMLHEKGLVKFKKGVTLKDLKAIAESQTDLESATEMKKAKEVIYELIRRKKIKRA